MCQSRKTGAKWWSGYTEQRVKGFAGNSSRRLWTPFTCNSANKNTIGAGFEITVAKEKTSTFHGAFSAGSVIGGDLRATQTWSSGVTIGYQTTSGFNICGHKGKWFQGVAKTREV